MSCNAYSVIIRTLSGGGKYERLLRSIESQNLKPEHVYIIQPYGVENAKPQLGFEEYIQTEKGMWSQRIFGMEYCLNQAEHSEYLLVCDDDVCFEYDFVSQLISIAKQNKADFLIPIEDNRKGRKSHLLGLFTGGRTENRSSKYKITIKSNSCFSVNNSLNNNVNPTQSGPFQCFLMRTDVTDKLNLRDEMWLDQTRYAWPDDQVFFYKAYLSGFNVLSCKNPSFTHLDGKSGVTDNQRRMDNSYAFGRNAYIFWKKFIYNRCNFLKKIQVSFAFSYKAGITCLMGLIVGIKRRDLRALRYYFKGLRDGYNYFHK